MAKYTITRSCGHDETHNIGGPVKLRDSKATWLESGICRECWAKEQAEARRAANVIASDANKANGLPALSGSPKQVDWAETIRAEKLAEIDTHYAKMLSQWAAMDLTPAQAEQIERGKHMFMAGLATLKGESSAAWWIDNKDRPGRLIVKQVADEVEAAK